MNKLRLAILLAACCALALSAASCASETATDTTAVSAGATATTGATSASTSGTVSPLTWTELEPVGDVPEPRAGQAMAYDSRAGKVLLFGGTNSVDFFDDTWEYDPAANTWTKLTPTGATPPERCAASMVYDSARGNVILYGGTSTTAFLTDVWEYDRAGNTWTELKPGGTAPSERVGEGMIYDSAHATVVLFGGRDEDDFLNDTWIYDVAGNTWTPVEPAGDLPSERYGHAMAYDETSGKVIVSGGWDSRVFLSSTWVYDPDADSWTSLDTTGDVPPPRAGHRLVYDSKSGEILLFGGNAQDAFFGDLRSYDPDTNTWTLFKPAGATPAARNGHAMVYDSANDTVIVFGGWNEMDYFNDTWSWIGQR